MSTLKIHHSTTFRHGRAATVSWQMLHLQPREETHQELVEFALDLNPEQKEVSKRLDYFGNTVHRFTTQSASEALKITMTSTVRRLKVELTAPENTGPAGEVSAVADAAIESGDFTLQQYRVETPAVPLLPGVLDITKDLSLEMPALTWLESLGKAFSKHYTFDSKATLITTPLQQVIEQRRGVCQDFSHLFISCLRQIGFPAAYVSGYLLTTPPPGQPRLRGVDAMHAWVSVWMPNAGWIDYDPTNECFVGENHVVVARGRDYNDISPIRGIFRGGARHVLNSSVTVEPEGEAAAISRPTEPSKASP